MRDEEDEGVEGREGRTLFRREGSTGSFKGSHFKDLSTSSVESAIKIPVRGRASFLHEVLSLVANSMV